MLISCTLKRSTIQPRNQKTWEFSGFLVGKRVYLKKLMLDINRYQPHPCVQLIYYEDHPDIEHDCLYDYEFQ